VTNGDEIFVDCPFGQSHFSLQFYQLYLAGQSDSTNGLYESAEQLGTLAARLVHERTVSYGNLSHGLSLYIGLNTVHRNADTLVCKRPIYHREGTIAGLNISLFARNEALDCLHLGSLHRC
jgi:hypothetical protein